MAENTGSTEIVEVKLPEATDPPATTFEPSLSLQPEATVASTAEPAATQTPSPVVDWRERRLAQQTAKLRETERKLAEAEAKLTASPTPSVAPGLDEARFNAAVQTEAQRQASQAEFNRQCNDVAQAGRLAHPDFNASIQGLTRLVDPTDPGQVARYNEFLSAAIETGAGARLIYDLGRDLNDAARVLALPPVKMAIELTKRATGQASGREVSGAPKPVTSVGGRGTTHEAIDPRDTERSDRLSTKEWMRRREEQMKRQA